MLVTRANTPNLFQSLEGNPMSPMLQAPMIFTICIAQNTYGAWLHHHSQWEIPRVFEPSVSGSTKDEAMSDPML